MSKIPFDPRELAVAKKSFDFFGNEIPNYTYPITPKEAWHRLYNKDGVWLPTDIESGVFCPNIIPDNKARGFVIEKNMIDPATFGGLDMFGVEWVYVPVAGGSMEKPDNPHLMSDVNDWEDVIKFPDVDSWDWKGSAEANKEYLDNGIANMFWFLNGMGFERLVSFMGFEAAAMALIDEEQEDALHALLSKLTDLHIHMVDLACDYYGDGIDGFTVHDDWGSQRSPFFSFDVAQDIFVPYMKKLTDHIKSRGKVADLHSCGHIEAQIENIIAGGWQSWTPMPMNDTGKLYDEYGDQIIIGVVDKGYPAGASDEEIARHAEEFAARYYAPDKPSTLSLYSTVAKTDTYREALYRASRMM